MRIWLAIFCAWVARTMLARLYMLSSCLVILFDVARKDLACFLFLQKVR